MRTSIVLSVIAAALLGYIFVFERGSISTGELERRKGSAVPEFVRERVSKLEIQRKGVTTVLVRDPDADPASDAALWRVEAPYRAKADQDAVETLLGEFEWVDGRRRLDEVSEADKKRFGLLAPRYRVWFTVGKTRVPVVVGGESPRGDGVYVAASDMSGVHVVGKDFVEALDHEPSHFHTKELHDGVMMLTTTEIALRGAAGEVAARKRDDGLWEFARGAQGLAAVPALQALIDTLDDMRAKRFVAQNVTDLARYGLAAPHLELTLNIEEFSDTKKDAQGKPVRERRTLRLRVGAECEGHAGERYAAVDGSKTVFCVASEDVSKLDRSAADLRETRLLPFEDDELSGVELERDGAKLALTRDGEKWSYETSRGGEPGLKGDAREGSAADWLKALRAVSAARFDGEPVPADEASVRVRFTRKERPPFELRLRQADTELVAVRGDEPFGVVFPASALELLTAEAARFRPLGLADHLGSDLQQLEIRRGKALERIARNESRFEVQAPLEAPADAIAAAEAVRLLAGLEAVRFAADAVQPVHGLTPPAFAITAQFQAAAKDGKTPEPQRMVLNVGAETEDGRYATLEGTPGVFVVSKQLADLLAAPLVSRTLPSTPLERLRALAIERGPQRFRIERAGDRFLPAAGTALDAETAQATASALATLRAVRAVAYGPPAPDQGMSRPYARMEVTAEGEKGREQRYTLLIGAETEGGRFARRDDEAVTFVLPADAVAALLPSEQARPAKTAATAPADAGP